MITFSRSPTFTQNERFVFHCVISGRCTTVQHPSFTEGGVSVLSFITRIDDDIHTDVRVYFVDVSSPYSVFILSTNRCSEFPCLASLYSNSGVPPSTPPAMTWLPLFL